MRLFGPLHPLVHFVRAIFQAEWVTTCLIVIDGKAQCLKIVKCLILSNCERNELCLFSKCVILRESSNETFFADFQAQCVKENGPYVNN